MCCGVSSGADWKNSAWYKKSDKSESVPESCCKKMTDGCSKGNSSNIYQEVSAEDFIILYTDQLPGLKSNPVFFIFTSHHTSLSEILKGHWEVEPALQFVAYEEYIIHVFGSLFLS